MVTGSSQVSIRVANGSLDYENPNQRKFIVLVSCQNYMFTLLYHVYSFRFVIVWYYKFQIIAEETLTSPKLSSTATLTVSITDANDNRPTFEQESYSTTISETANPGQLITTITAKDLDSGHYGDQGLRYSLSGTGAELFNVDPITGAITVAECPRSKSRRRRQISDGDELQYNSEDSEAKNVNITHVGETGLLSIDAAEGPSTENNQFLFYPLDNNDHNENSLIEETTNEQSPTEKPAPSIFGPGPGKHPCLDYEAQNVYFLSYRVSYYQKLKYRYIIYERTELKISKPGDRWWR